MPTTIMLTPELWIPRDGICCWSSHEDNRQVRSRGTLRRALGGCRQHGSGRMQTGSGLTRDRQLWGEL